MPKLSNQSSVNLCSFWLLCHVGYFQIQVTINTKEKFSEIINNLFFHIKKSKCRIVWQASVILVFKPCMNPFPKHGQKLLLTSNQ